ncbi:hypothetical protein [Achromobacter piechaudii]|uniref:Uncharacterized protein n=1 Tax=Achromobacter piechaudii TaxID=72556 RepID=A0A6S7DW70_9BURK|nr:hypothetical protein [Achromobacter piechaudii]CAB3875721.1 hypothetical protein LMG1861_03005 [Achromobacter piechaudii]
MLINVVVLLLALLALMGLLFRLAAPRGRMASGVDAKHASGPSPVRRWCLRIVGASCLALSALFFYAWYAFYWKWDFNELGRYYDPVDQVVYTTSGFVWILPATLLLAAGWFCFWRGWRR